MQAYLHLYLLCYSAPLQKSMKVNKEYVLQVESILLLLSIKPHQYSSPIQFREVFYVACLQIYCRNRDVEK